MAGSVVDEQLGAQRRPAGPGARPRSRGSRWRTRSRAYTGPVSSPASSAMMHTPVSVSPASIARSTGAAPRHRGSSEKCTFTNPPRQRVEQRLREDLAEGDDHAELGARRRRPRRSPRATGRACAPAGRAPPRPPSPGSALGSLPRPRRRSGCVTTSATSCPASCSAWRTGTASAGVPKKTRRTDSTGLAEMERSLAGRRSGIDHRYRPRS